MRNIFISLFFSFALIASPLISFASEGNAQAQGHPLLLAVNCVDIETGAPIDCGSSSAIPGSNSSDSGTSPTGGDSGTSPTGGDSGTSKSFNPFKQDTHINSLCDLVNKLLDIITQIGAIVAVVFIIWSGFLFVTAQGNQEKLKHAKRTFVTTIIGTAVVLGASVMTKIVINTVGSVTTAISGSPSANICASQSSS